MSFSGTPTSGANNVPYMGLSERNPRETYQFERNPTVNDYKAYKVGDRWINKLASSAFILVSKANNIAAWLPLSGGGAGLQTLTGNDFIPVIPVLGNINIMGPNVVSLTNGGPGQLNVAVAVDGTSIQIIANQLTANTSAILAGYQIDVDVGANVSPVGAILQVPGLGGNQTLNGGAGIVQINNRRWLSAYVVDQNVTPGSDAEYSTIQSAIDAAFAAGGGTVYVRFSSTPYVENLILRSHVDLQGISIDGRLPSSLSQVAVQGQHVFNTAAGLNECVIAYIDFEDPTFGDLFTINSTGGGLGLVAFKYCNLASFNGGGPGSGRCIVINADAISQTLAIGYDVQMSADINCMEMIGAGFQQATLTNSTASANNVVIKCGSGLCSVDVKTSTFSAAASCFEDATGTTAMNIEYCTMQANGPCILFAGAAANCLSLHSSYNSNSFFAPISGAGQFSHADTIFNGPSQTIDPATTVVALNWQPYAQSAAGSVGSVRGTSSFDNSQFVVTDGFVQFTGSGGTTWTDEIVPFTGAASNGYFVTNPLVATLPAGAAQGDTIEIVDDFGGGVIIQANAAQVIRIGNVISSVAGTATTTQQGDSIRLVFRFASSTWIAAPGVEGNWILA